MSAPSVVQSTHGVVTHSTPFHVPFVSNNTAGNLIIAIASITVIGGTTFPTPTISDSLTQTYTLLFSPINSGTFASDYICGIWVYYVSNCSAGANTVTLTSSGSGQALYLDIIEIAGAATSGFLDGYGIGITNSSSALGVATVDLTTVNSTDLLVCAALTLFDGFDIYAGGFPVFLPSTLSTLQLDGSSGLNGLVQVFTETLSGTGTFAFYAGFQFGSGYLMNLGVGFCIAISNNTVIPASGPTLTSGGSNLSGTNEQINAAFALALGSGNYSGTNEEIALAATLDGNGSSADNEQIVQEVLGMSGPPIPLTGQSFPYRIA
jgi:hypothetical protein